LHKSANTAVCIHAIVLTVHSSRRAIAIHKPVQRDWPFSRVYLVFPSIEPVA